VDAPLASVNQPAAPNAVATWLLLLRFGSCFACGIAELLAF
jgi:hypothetical protein